LALKKLLSRYTLLSKSIVRQELIIILKTLVNMLLGRIAKQFAILSLARLPVPPHPLIFLILRAFFKTRLLSYSSIKRYFCQLLFFLSSTSPSAKDVIKKQIPSIARNAIGYTYIFIVTMLKMVYHTSIPPI